MVDLPCIPLVLLAQFFLKWNADDFSLGKSGPAGMGGVLRNSIDYLTCLFSYPIDFTYANKAKHECCYKKRQQKYHVLRVIHMNGIFMLRLIDTIFFYC